MFKKETKENKKMLIYLLLKINIVLLHSEKKKLR